METTSGNLTGFAIYCPAITDEDARDLAKRNQLWYTEFSVKTSGPKYQDA